MSTVRVPSCNFPWAQLTVGCMDCKVKRANFGLPNDRLRRWCGTCARQHEGAIDVVNKRCEDCQKKRPNFGMPDERKARWCHGCSQKHEGAENVVSKRCEECKNKQPSYGMPADNKQRWCQPCSTKHPGAVNLVGKKKVGKAQASGGRPQPIPQPTPVAASHEPVAGVAVIAEKAPDLKRPMTQMVPVPVERPPAKRQAITGLQEPSPLTAHVAPMPPRMGPPAGLPPMTAPMASVAAHTPLAQPMEFQGLAPPNPYGATAIPSTLGLQPPHHLREYQSPHHETVRASAVATATIPDAVPAGLAMAAPSMLQPLQQPLPPSAEQLPSGTATASAVGERPALALQYHYAPPPPVEQLHLQQQMHQAQAQRVTERESERQHTTATAIAPAPALAPAPARAPMMSSSGPLNIPDAVAVTSHPTPVPAVTRLEPPSLLP